MQYGRREIFTDVEFVDKSNIITVLQRAMNDFRPNAEDCTFLLKYEKGYQPLQRKEGKKYRPDIDVNAVDNVANEIVEFKTSFNWNPITLVQRGEKDSGTEKETHAISLLNECYASEEIVKKTRRLARFVEVCGIGYTMIDLNADDFEEGDSYFKYDVLDPRYAFVVRSSRYPDHRAMLGVSFSRDNNGNCYFTCFTKHERFEIFNAVRIIEKGMERDADKWGELPGNGEENPLHRIPITEWIRDFDRMGCFERQLSSLDNLNLLLSDFSNSVEQNVQAVWWASDTELPKEIINNEDGTQTKVVKKLKDGDWLNTFTAPDGKTPSIKPLTIDYDYEGMTTHYMYQRSLVLQKCNVPTRDAEMSNSTGLAASFAGGYAGAESQADKQADIMYGCKMEEVKSALAAIRECPHTPADSPLLKLKYKDVQPKLTRQRSYELSVKSTAFATLVSHGIQGMQALKAVNLFEDVAQAWSDSRESIEKFQASLFEKGSASSPEKDEKLQSNNADQVLNSPLIDGMGTGKPETVGM